MCEVKLPVKNTHSSLVIENDSKPDTKGWKDEREK